MFALDRGLTEVLSKPPLLSTAKLKQNMQFFLLTKTQNQTAIALIQPHTDTVGLHYCVVFCPITNMQYVLRPCWFVCE